MKHEPHNPYYKLVGVEVKNANGHIELVYGIANDGTNEGIEVYFLNPGGSSYGHYRSYRYLTADCPAKYRTWFVKLRRYAREGEVKAGHKLSLPITSL